MLEEVVGYFATQTSRRKAADMLNKAWKSGATEFTVPQDTFAKSAVEQFDDLCEEHGLTCVSINELGYHRWDIPRNLQIWRETDEFEKRGILVADPDGDYSPEEFGGAYAKSLKKWQALQAAKKILPYNNPTPVKTSSANKNQRAMA